jgi:hypothetical protein
LRRPSLRSQLNQVRLWVRQGRTDAWIAHKLDISVEQLEQFKRDHRLDAEQPAEADPVVVGETPLESRRTPEPPEPEAAPEPELDYGDDEDEDRDEAGRDDDERDDDRGDDERPSRRRRRGRRGGRRRTRPRTSFEGTFDHGEEGYGLWLDPAVADNPVYSEHWAGHREVTVVVDADAITIRRAGGERERED